jgi:hypothetical protein
LLVREQAAIRQVLAWIARRQASDDEPGDGTAGS